MFPGCLVIKLLFLKKTETCAFGVQANGKKGEKRHAEAGKEPSHAHLAFSPIVCDVMNPGAPRKAVCGQAMGHYNL